MASPICSFIAAVLCLVSSGRAEAGQQVLEGPARVIDGDTLEVNICAVKHTSNPSALALPVIRNGGSGFGLSPQVAGQRVRLFGLDAPEKAQLCSDRDGNPYACGVPQTCTASSKSQHLPTCELNGRI